MANVETISFRRRNLPHWLVADRTYFVTVRLKGTLPADVVEALRLEREQLRAQEPDDEDAMNQLRIRQFDKIESILDAGSLGEPWMSRPKVADLVFGNLAWLDDVRGWRIHAACVMPTHLHVLMRNTEGRNGELCTDLGLFKNYTAREANRVLGRKGAFWTPEDFDHWCRSDAKVTAATEYIRDNPVKAGLASSREEWKWIR